LVASISVQVGLLTTPLLLQWNIRLEDAFISILSVHPRQLMTPEIYGKGEIGGRWGGCEAVAGLSSGIHFGPNCGIEGAKYDQLREARERIDGGLKEYGRATSEGKQG
jgi:hypothetical protein